MIYKKTIHHSSGDQAMKKNILKNQKGMSIIEVVMAMVIFAICFQGLAFMGLYSVRANKMSVNKTKATNLAQQRIEYLKGASFNSLSNLAGTEGSISGHSGYTRITKIEDSANDPDMKVVTVQIIWDSGKQSVSLETLISEEGV